MITCCTVNRIHCAADSSMLRADLRNATEAVEQFSGKLLAMESCMDFPRRSR